MTIETPGREAGFSDCKPVAPEIEDRSNRETGTAEVFDRVAALLRVEGDGELLLEIVEVFLEDSPRLISRLREAVESQDLRSLELAAHTLKGSLGNFCAPAAYAAAVKLEEIGRSGIAEGVQDAWVELEETMVQLRLALLALHNEGIV